MRNSAALALTVASAFMAVVAVLVGSSALFYMGVALVATIFAAKFQAWIAVQDLRVTRMAPSEIELGEEATIVLSVESDRKVQRPLTQFSDELPRRMQAQVLAYPMPVAPDFGRKLHMTYRIRALRRGEFRWSRVRVKGADGMGLSASERVLETDITTLVVLPIPIPFPISLPIMLAIGEEESQSRPIRSSAGDPAGIRPYVSGDSFRRIHWPGTARTGNLMVREFESPGSQHVDLWIQWMPEAQESEVLELACGHLLDIAKRLFAQGCRISFEGTDIKPGDSNPIRPLQRILSQERFWKPGEWADHLRQESEHHGGAKLVLIHQPEPGILDFARLHRASDLYFVGYETGSVMQRFLNHLEAIGPTVMRIQEGRS